MNDSERATRPRRRNQDSPLPLIIGLSILIILIFVCGCLLFFYFVTPGKNLTEVRTITKHRRSKEGIKRIHEDLSNLSRNCTNHTASSDRCTDFYSYATNFWLPLEPDLLKKSTMFLKNLQMLSLLTEAYSSMMWRTIEKTEAEEKATIFFETCINTDIILEQGIEPLRRGFLDTLNGWPLVDKNWNGTYHSMVYVLARLDRMGFYNGLFTLLPLNEVFADKKLAKTILITPSTSLIDITFDGEASDNDIMSMARELGIHPSTKDQLSEMSTFQDSVTEIEEKYKRDIQKAVKSSKKLSDLTMQTKFDWNEYFFHSLGGAASSINLEYLFDDEYISAICNLLSKTKPRTVVNYAIWTALKRIYSHTNVAINQTYPLNYYHNHESGKVLYAQRKILCMHYQTTLLSYATTRTLIDTFDLSREISIIREMGKNISEIAKNEIKRSSLLSKSNIKSVLAKFDTMNQYYLYPSWIEDQEKLDQYYQDVIISDSYLINYISLSNLLRQSLFQKLFDDNHLETWLLSPLDVNAYCLMAKNQIVVPISLISFIEPTTPMALLYSTIGFIIAHEMMHSFDPSGIGYDKDGKDNNVLDEEGAKFYAGQESCLYNQYYKMCIIKGEEMGEYAGKTLGENFADTLGLRYSYYAFRRTWLPYNHENLTNPYSEFSPEQLFFLGVAFLWYDLPIRSKEEFQERLDRDVHSPGKFRVNGPMQNLKDFSRVFDCPRKSPMNRGRKCVIW